MSRVRNSKCVKTSGTQAVLYRAYRTQLVSAKALKQSRSQFSRALLTGH